jgi:diacylglycerol kinase (ATP)
MSQPHQQPLPWLTKRIAAFRYAFEGMFYLIRTQPHAKFHSFAGVVVVAFGLAIGLSQAEWLALAITITMVIAAEGINTAIEATVDLASPQHHPLAKVAKDVGAGTVLITAFGAIAVGLIIFLPHLWRAILWLLGR